MRNANKHRLELINEGAATKPGGFELMSPDELWTLHEEIAATLERRLIADKTRLEERLRQLKQQGELNTNSRLAPVADLTRRSYRSTKILLHPSRLGPVVAGSPAGYQHNSNQEKSSMLSGSNRLMRPVDAHLS